MFSEFDYHQKRKSRQMCENLERYVCLDLPFEENAYLNTRHLRKSRRTEVLGVSTSGLSQNKKIPIVYVTRNLMKALVDLCTTYNIPRYI